MSSTSHVTTSGGEPARRSSGEIRVTAPGPKVVVTVAAANLGPPGPPGRWLALTQADYDQLDPPDPETLYVIVPA